MLERLRAVTCKADRSGWGKAGWNDEDFSCKAAGEDSKGAKREKKLGLEQKYLLTSYTSSQLQDVKPAERIQKKHVLP